MKFGLIGNPNVGKSLIFNQLTGLGVEVSNYAGTTVGLATGSTCFKRERFELVDLPGIYSLDGLSPEEQLVRHFLEEKQADVIISVIDAAHLERNLYLLVEVAEYDLPMIAVVNMIDEAEKQGLSIDYGRLSDRLGIEVIPTAAIKGQNIDQIIAAARERAKRPEIVIDYDHHIEAAVKSLGATYGTGRLAALQSLLGVGTDTELVEAAALLSRQIEERHHMSVDQIIAINRHNYARLITDEVLHQHKQPHRFDLEPILTSSFPGIPILVIILVSMLLVVFLIGSDLEQVIVWALTVFVLDPFLALGLPPFAEQLGTSVILALQAGLGIALPFIFTFYIFIAVLEDSGYLTRAAFLADRSMHRMGLHGQAIIPMVLGFGCTVPAIMNIRLLTTRRERVIASFLVTLIPCSGRAVIIAGILATFVGLFAALSVYLIIFILIILTALVLGRIAPGEQVGMILELAPLRRPKPGNVLRKSWMRIREFLIIAMPLLLITSILLGTLQYLGVVTGVQAMLAPVSGWLLGLPPYATTALIFGIFRKEMALETLVILAGTADLSTVMTSLQLYVFAIVSVLFIPCISTVAVLSREMGLRIALLVSFYTVALGIGIGALINFLIL
jgi:ferrous iron transport protein B